jgi:epoxyqueuosine reductase
VVAAPAEIVEREARDLGFVLAGCAPIDPLPRRAFLERWIADGRAGEMRYLTRRTEQRLDPRTDHPWARSMIVVGWPYRPPPPPPEDWRASLRGRIAAYALGADYHDHVLASLEQLAARLAAHFPESRYLSYVDTGPILEREWGVRAGLGWVGRHTLLLQRARGSYFLLGELLTDVEVATTPPAADHCGSCTRCIDVCPTGALAGDYTMDPRRCISYLTIEHWSAIPTALRPGLGNWIFGCDLCQEACPWNDDPGPGATDERLAPHLPTLLSLDEAGFTARFRGTPLLRPGRRGLLRNACVVLGNSGNPDAVPALAGALEDPEPLVRQHAAWALGRLGGGAARRALEAARARDPSAAVRVEVDDALAGRPACAPVVTPFAA